MESWLYNEDIQLNIILLNEKKIEKVLQVPLYVIVLWVFTNVLPPTIDEHCEKNYLVI